MDHTMPAEQRHVRSRVRALIATILEMDPDTVNTLTDSTPLFGSGLSLDSLTGLELLTGIKAEFDVDIAAKDLNLSCLETIGTLVSYVSDQSDSSQIDR